MTKEEIGERQVKEWVEQLHGRNVWKAALVSIDPRTGEVLTYVGSVDYNNRDDPRVQGQFDVAGIWVLHPCSRFYKFNYVTALKEGATSATGVVDARNHFTREGEPTRMKAPPRRYLPGDDDRHYH